MRPVLQEKSRHAREAAVESLRRRHRLVHAPQRRARSSSGSGSPACRSPRSELYERLKKRERPRSSPATTSSSATTTKTGRHRHECIRVTYAMDEAVVSDGLKIIAEEVYRGKGHSCPFSLIGRRDRNVPSPYFTSFALSLSQSVKFPSFSFAFTGFLRIYRTAFAKCSPSRISVSR